ncbi:hypothetical protein Vi05172_g6370 [Venturia inaequalis]|nr:hypothetical protein Vi05172_g6370 [Venturia inaequalis]
MGLGKRPVRLDGPLSRHVGAKSNVSKRLLDGMEAS